MKEELARRAVASKHWRWMPGMNTIGDIRVLYQADDDSGEYDLYCDGGYLSSKYVLPDFTDDATIGCLQRLVCYAWNDRGISCVCAGYRDGVYWYRVVEGHHHGMKFKTMSQKEYQNRAEALVAALEAAP